MAKIIVEEGEPIDRALKRFKKECQKAGIPAEVRRREFFEKPSVRRKRKDEAAARKSRRRMLKQQRRLEKL
jgi:small subunit ribosomal protein S21